MAKLTIAQWALCRDDFENKGMSLSELSAKYGVNKSNISRRANTEKWTVSAVQQPAPKTQQQRNSNATGVAKPTTVKDQSVQAKNATAKRNDENATGKTQQQNATPKNAESIEESLFDDDGNQTYDDIHARENESVAFDDDFDLDDYDVVNDARVKASLNSIDVELSVLANAYGGLPNQQIKYHPAFARVAYKAAMLGITQKNLADIIGVDESTVRLWIRTRKEFAIAWKGGSAYADMRVVNSMFKSANGFHERIKETKFVAGEEVEVERSIYVEPSFNAQRFWLINRQPELWRDKVEVVQEITAAVIDKAEMKNRYDRVLEHAEELRQQYTGRAERLNLVLDGDAEDE